MSGYPQEKKKDNGKSRSKKQKEEQEMPNMIGEFKVLKTIGRGSFGRVYLGMHLANDAYVAIKHALPGPKNKPFRYRNFLKNEAGFLKQLNHVNILNCYKVKD